MFFLFGTKVVQRRLPAEHKVCPTCLSVTQHAVTEHDTRFTLYFVPLFSIKRDIVYLCARCGDSHVVPYAEYEAWRQGVVERDEPQAPSAPAVGRGSSLQTARDKARLILDGKVAGRKAERPRAPFAIRITGRQLYLSLWVAFGLIVSASIALLIVLISIMSQ